MSYSKFEYSDLKLSNKSFAKIGKIEVSVTLKNNSNIAGKEVVQLYIRDLFASTTRPVKELKDFEMIELEPNEPKIVKFYIYEKTIEFYPANNKWEAESGDFNVFVGTNSEKPLEDNFVFTAKFCY